MPPLPRQKITVRLLESLKPGELVRDDRERGFSAERGRGPGVSFKVQADIRTAPRTGTAREAKAIRITVGRWPTMTLDAARTEAKRLLAEIKAGRDPRAAAPATSWTVGRAFEAYIRDVAKRPGSELTQRDLKNRLARYLDDWREIPLASLTRELCEARHLKIAADVKARAATRRATGARTANATIRDLSAVWNYAADFVPLPPNPCRKIKMIGEVRAHHEIPMAELAAWWTAVGALPNPLRRAMHRFALLSGLRPSNVTDCRREWIRLDEPAGARIVFPAAEMKGRRDFTLPLSAAMVAIVREALAAGDLLFQGSPWLFPSRSMTGVVQPTAVAREKSAALRNKTGHALRHTWKTCARNARLPESQIELLLAHRLGGQRDTYGSLAEQFDRLLADQETVTSYILAKVAGPASATAAPSQAST